MGIRSVCEPKISSTFGERSFSKDWPAVYEALPRMIPVEHALTKHIFQIVLQHNFPGIFQIEETFLHLIYNGIRFFLFDERGNPPVLQQCGIRVINPAVNHLMEMKTQKIHASFGK